jgi:hypothetical protein
MGFSCQCTGLYTGRLCETGQSRDNANDGGNEIHQILLNIFYFRMIHNALRLPRRHKALWVMTQ